MSTRPTLRNAVPLHRAAGKLGERATFVLSLDTEQIWGYLNLLDQYQFDESFPYVEASYERVLRFFGSAHISATWFVVGGLALPGSEGPGDRRMSGLPEAWIRNVPSGNEVTAPLWYRSSFVRQLAKARPLQDIGLHGGLTHLIWTDRHSTEEVARRELQGGLGALAELGIHPRTFSFARNQLRYLSLLREHGICCYRGRDRMLSARMGRTLLGSVVRLAEEITRVTPPPVWPEETIPGLWNIPGSMFLYSIRESRRHLVSPDTRRDRIRLGVEAAIRNRGVFHFYLHPDNLAESPRGFSLFEEMLEPLLRARELGDIEILTMTELAERMTRAKTSVPEPDRSAARYG